MKKNFKLIIMGVAVLSVLYITACARKDKAKESAQADKDIVVMSFSDDKKNTELDGKLAGMCIPIVYLMLSLMQKLQIWR